MTNSRGAPIQTVLISEPQSFNQAPYYPYVWAVLKSFSERVELLKEHVQWLEPVYRKGDAASLLEPYRHAPPDVLGLSCYTWNWSLQCRIAETVKSWNPDCLVVAGGPHPDYKDADFFRKHPYIDVVAVKDGEITFSAILSHLVSGKGTLSDVRGLYLPGKDGGGPDCTGQAEVPSEFAVSPYVAQSAYFEELNLRFGPSYFDVIWETNRGCPYSCNFCDWGSNTMSKIRRFDMDRIRTEIEWFARMRIKSIILADANFGILPRDLEIADMLNRTRAERGYPRFMHYSPAKNNPERTVEIAERFVKSGLSPVHTFAVQHTDPVVLAAADRENISVSKQRQVAKAVVAKDIPTLVQLIVGIPGDTYDLWKTCLTDLMDWGLHDNYQIFNYTLLPNAPAADREFLRQWEVETISRYVPKEGTGQRNEEDRDALTGVDIIVGSRTYSRGDWAKMKAYAAFIKALHNRSLTRLIAMYLHFSHGVSYRTFYDRVVDRFFSRCGHYRKLVSHFEGFVSNPNSLEDLRFERFPEHHLYFEAGRWVFVEICCDFDRYFDELKTFLLAEFPSAANLYGAIDYQRNLVILPKHGDQRVRSFGTEFDWIGYFEKARLLTEYEPMPEPAPAPGGIVVVGDRFEWDGKDADNRWLAWIEHTREVQRALSINFRDLRLERKAG